MRSFGYFWVNPKGFALCRRALLAPSWANRDGPWAQGGPGQIWIFSFGVEPGEKLVPRANGTHHEARAAESRQYEEAGRLLREVKDLETQLAEACDAAKVLLNAVDANE